MGKLLRRANDDDEPYDNCAKESNTESFPRGRHLPHKLPSLLSKHVFEELLGYSLKFMPQERAVFLTANQVVCDEGKTTVIFCIRFLTVDLFIPATFVRLDGNNAYNLKQLKRCFKLCIEDLSILNVNVIGSISESSEMFVNVLAQFNKDLNKKELYSELTYTVLPFKDIVHIFCYKSLETKLNISVLENPYIYIICLDNKRPEDILCEPLAVTRTGIFDLMGNETNIADMTKIPSEQLDSKIATLLSCHANPDALNSLALIFQHAWTLRNSLNRHSQITPERLAEILEENSHLTGCFACIKVSNVKLTQSDLHEPLAPPVNHAVTLTKRFLPPNVEGKSPFPCNPYYLLSKETCRQFMKPSGCVGKRSEAIRKEIARRAEQHRKKDTTSSENLDEKIVQLLTFVRERLNAKDESGMFHETADGGKILRQCIDFGEAVNIQLKSSKIPKECIENDNNRRGSIGDDGPPSQRTASSHVNVDVVFKIDTRAEGLDHKGPQDTVIVENWTENKESFLIATEIVNRIVANVEYNAIEKQRMKGILIPKLDNEKLVENNETSAIVTEIIQIILTKVEAIAKQKSLELAYNHLMSMLNRVAAPVDIFQHYIATYKGYHRLYNKMLNYDIKSVQADVFHLQSIAYFIDKISLENIVKVLK